MHRTKGLLGVLFLMVGLSGCSPMNSEFSCNATAGDRCLSIEEVNAMTEVELPIRPQHAAPKPMRAPLRRAENAQTIWIAPWTDEKGHVHNNGTLFARNDAINPNQTR